MELQIMKQPALCFKCGFRHPQSYLFSGLICIDDDLDSSLSQTFCHRLSVQFLFNFNSPLFPFLKNVFLTATFPVRPLYVFMWIQINRKLDVFLCITEGHSAANLCGMRTVSSPGGLLINTSFSDFNPRNTENVKNLPSKQNKQKQCIQKDQNKYQKSKAKPQLTYRTVYMFTKKQMTLGITCSWLMPIHSYRVVL